jgi:recombination protein RecA
MATTAAALRIQIQASLAPRFDVDFTLRRKPHTDLLPGDISRGAFTEIFGLPSSGRTAFLFRALAHVTHRPEFCALIDAADSFDPTSAAQAGVHLPHLLWVRCGGNAEHALKATDLLVQAGFGMVVLDLAGVPQRDARRISLASWYRLRNAVEKTPTALVTVEQELNAKSCSGRHIQLRAQCGKWSGNLLTGFSA